MTGITIEIVLEPLLVTSFASVSSNLGEMSDSSPARMEGQADLAGYGHLGLPDITEVFT